MSGTGEAPMGAAGAGGTLPSSLGIEAWIGHLLTAGTRLAFVLFAVGSALLVKEGIPPTTAEWPPLDLASLPADLLALRPEAYLWLGLIVTITTPLLRVTAATISFARNGEPRMVLLGVAVLVVISVAVVAGMASG
jgi:uncharacterized membrane protein